jgi:hypothetical protein
MVDSAEGRGGEVTRDSGNLTELEERKVRMRTRGMRGRRSVATRRWCRGRGEDEERREDMELLKRDGDGGRGRRD